MSTKKTNDNRAGGKASDGAGPLAHRAAFTKTTPKMAASEGDRVVVDISSFADNLRQHRLSRGMSKSDVAREIWGETQDTLGRPVAKNRDRISVWESGKATPEPHNLQLLADLFDTTPEKLAPNLAMDRAKDGSQRVAMSMTMVSGKPDQVFLQVNTLASLQVASQVIALLSKDPVVVSTTVKGT